VAVRVDDPAKRKPRAAWVAEVPIMNAVSCWAVIVLPDDADMVNAVVEPAIEITFEAALHDDAETYIPTELAVDPKTTIVPPDTMDDPETEKSVDVRAPAMLKIVDVEGPVIKDPLMIESCVEDIVD
jgi:uncharacterized protein YcgI (DUF1989 family)